MDAEGDQYLFGIVSSSAPSSDFVCPRCLKGALDHTGIHNTSSYESSAIGTGTGTGTGLSPARFRHLIRIAESLGKAVSRIEALQKSLMEEVEIMLEKIDDIEDETKMRGVQKDMITKAASLGMTGKSDAASTTTGTSKAGTNKGVARKRLRVALADVATRIAQKMRSSSNVQKKLQEIKSYSKPPPVVLKVMVALFYVLGLQGLDQYVKMGETQLWQYIRANINTQKPNPRYLPKLMRALMDKVGKGEKLDAKAGAMARKYMKGVSHEITKRGSMVLPPMRKYILSVLMLDTIASDAESDAE